MVLQLLLLLLLVLLVLLVLLLVLIVAVVQPACTTRRNRKANATETDFWTLIRGLDLALSEYDTCVIQCAQVTCLERSHLTGHELLLFVLGRAP